MPTRNNIHKHLLIDSEIYSAKGAWDGKELDDLLDGGTRTEFILRYTLSHPDMHTTIVGTADVDHLTANLAAARKGPLAADVYAEALAPAQRATDQLALPGEVDDDLGDARARQRFEVILDERFAADFEQRLRLRIGERAHAFAAPRGQDHGAHSASRARGFERWQHAPIDE